MGTVERRKNFKFKYAKKYIQNTKFRGGDEVNKKTVALEEEQYKNIIDTIHNGFICDDGHIVKPNNRVATILVLEANLGLRISDILQLRLSAIIRDGDRYRLNIIEKKNEKET